MLGTVNNSGLIFLKQESHSLDIEDSESFDNNKKVRYSIQWRGVKYYPSREKIIQEIKSEIMFNKRTSELTKSYSTKGRSKSTRAHGTSMMSTMKTAPSRIKSGKSGGRRKSRTIFVTIAKKSHDPNALQSMQPVSTVDADTEAFLPDIFSFETTENTTTSSSKKTEEKEPPDLLNFEWLSNRDDYHSELLEGVHVPEDYNRVVSQIAGNQLFQNKGTKYRNVKKKMSELKGLPRPEALMKALLKEQILHQPYNIENAEWVRELYTNAIMKHSGLYRILLRRPEIISGEAEELMKEAKAVERIETEECMPHVFDDITDWDRAFFTSLYCHAKNVHEEMEMEILDFESFFGPVFAAKHETAVLNKDFIRVRNTTNIRSMIQEVTEEIHEVREYPGINIFKYLMTLLRTCEANPVLLSEMARTFDQWLDQLVKCIISPYHSVRLNGCCALAYVFSLPRLASSIRCNRYNDIIFDVVTQIIRAMDIYPQSFTMYFCILSYIMDEYPTHSVLDSVTQKVPLCRCIAMQEKWPLLLYYAFRHWSMDKFVTSELYIQRMLELLENALMKYLPKRAAKKALAQLSLRYRVRPNLITLYPINYKSADDALLF